MDLRELMEQRSAQPQPTVLHNLRMAEVRRRVVARRRQRFLTGVAAVLVAALVAGAAATDLPGFDRSLSPAEGEVDGFPEYRDGNRVLAATSARLQEWEVELTFVPATDRPVIYWRCEQPVSLWSALWSTQESVVVHGIEVRLNGHSLTSTPDVRQCGGPFDITPGGVDDWVAEFGLRVGEPNSLTVSVSGEFTTMEGEPVQVPRRAAWGVAVAEPVPFEEYDLPPHPEVLEPIVEPEPCDHFYPYRLRAPAGDPNRAVRVTIEVNRYQVEALIQTPGHLSIKVDGVVAGRFEQWAYGVTDHPWATRQQVIEIGPDVLGQAGLEVGRGGWLTLTVKPEHMSGDWLVLLTPHLGASCR
jgi:hypothetical protein